MQLLKKILLLLLVASVHSFNKSIFEIKPSVMFQESKEFVSEIISKYGSVKYECVLLFINKIHPDYGDYIVSAISNLNSTGYIMNFYQNKNVSLVVSIKFFFIEDIFYFYSLR